MLKTVMQTPQQIHRCCLNVFSKDMWTFEAFAWPCWAFPVPQFMLPTRSSFLDRSWGPTNIQNKSKACQVTSADRKARITIKNPIKKCSLGEILDPPEAIHRTGQTVKKTCLLKQKHAPPHRSLQALACHGMHWHAKAWHGHPFGFWICSL